MPKDVDEGTQILNQIIEDLTQLRKMPAPDRLAAIVAYIDRGPARIEGRLAHVRQLSVRAAIQAISREVVDGPDGPVYRGPHGAQRVIATQLGITPQRVSSLANGRAGRRREPAS